MNLNTDDTKGGFEFRYLPFFSGSLVFQIIQIGVYPILLSQVMSRYSYDNFLIGLLLSVSWLSVFALGPFVPNLIYRIGHKRVLLLSFLATGTGIFALMVSGHLVVLSVSSLLVGGGLILRWISCDTLLVEVSDPASTGKMIGFHEALMGLGIALGPLFFVYFEIWSVVWLCLGLAICGQGLFLATNISRGSERSADENSTGWKPVARLIIVALAAAFVSGFIESSSIALLPLHFENFGFSLATSAIFVSSFGFGGTLLQPPLGYLSDKFGYAFSQLLCLIGVCAGCVIVVFAPMNFSLMVLVLFIIGGAAGGLNTLAVIEAGKTLNQSVMAQAMTAIAMLYTLGGVSGPVMAGATLELFSNTGMIWLFAAVSAILAALLLLRQIPTRNIR